MTGSGTGTSRRGGNQAAVTVHGGIDGGPRPFHRLSRRVARPSLSLPRGRPAAPCKQDPLCLSLRGREPVPGDWAHGLVRGREPVSGGWANPGPRVSPLTGENKRGLPLHRRDPVPEGCKPHVPLRLSPHRGEQEGSCDAGILRFPHRLTDPRFVAKHRSPAGLPPQSFRKVRTDADR